MSLWSLAWVGFGAGGDAALGGAGPIPRPTGLGAIPPPKFPVSAPQSLPAGGACLSACRNLPCPPRDLFTPSPGRTFRVPPLFCLQRSATLPRARLAAPGTAPGTETRPVSLGPARPGPAAAALGLDGLNSGKTRSWCSNRPGPEERAGGDGAPHPAHPKSGFLTPFLAPFVSPFQGLCPCRYSRGATLDPRDPAGRGLGTAAGTKGSPTRL